MKNLLMASAFIIATGSAFAADKVVLNCTTPGDALSSVELVEKSSEALVVVRGLDDSVKKFNIRSSLKNIVKGDSDTLIATSKKSIDFGGATSDAVLLRVLPGQKKALMAMGGAVYTMDCQK